LKSLQELIREKELNQKLREKAIQIQKDKERLQEFKKNGKKLEKEHGIIKEQPRLKEKVVELTKLTMDEIRASYIFHVKKSPKHDSKQTKDFLIEEIIKKLRDSKLN